VGTRLLEKVGREVVADTLALFLFSLAGFLFTIFYEMLIIGISVQQWLGIRIVYNTIRALTAVPLARFNRFLRRRFVKESSNWWVKPAVDTLSVWLYQLPIYIVSAAVVGMSSGQVLAGCAFDLIEYVAVGWTYGPLLTWSRARLRVGKE